MSFARVSISVFGMMAVIAAMLAGAAIWLVLTDPVTVVDAVNEGNISPLVRELAGVIYRALSSLMKYL